MARMPSWQFVEQSNIPDNGASRNIHSLAPVQVGQDHGYIVGIEGHERVLPSPIGVHAADAHMAQLHADPAVREDPHALQGSWNEPGKGTVTLDRSRRYGSHEFHEAYHTAREGNQKALFDVHQGRDIGVHEPQPGDLNNPVLHYAGQYRLHTVKQGGMTRSAPQPTAFLRTSQLSTPSFGIRRSS